MHTCAYTNLYRLSCRDLTLHRATSALPPLQPAPTPTSVVPSALQCPKPLVPFESYTPLFKDPYKLVKFWDRGQWKTRCESEQGKTKLNNAADTVKKVSGRNSRIDGGNITMLYVEKEDGEPIDGERASEISEFRRIFRMLDHVSTLR